MAWFLGQSWLFLALAFLLGLLVGWLIWGRSKPEVAEAEAKPEVAEAEPEVAEAEPEVAEAEPEIVTQPEPPEPEPEVVTDPAPKPDNLQRIEGIGPKISSTLTAAGIVTFSQLATCDQPTLVEVLRKGGVRFAPSLSTWTHQAELLAQGDEAGFTQLTRQLTASRRAR